MKNPAEQFMRDSLAAWEKAASQWSESFVRDPRTLELGSEMLRAGLSWKRSFDEAAEQAWTQWIALATQGAAK